MGSVIKQVIVKGETKGIKGGNARSRGAGKRSFRRVGGRIKENKRGRVEEGVRKT